jgi:hypothetical protein
VESGEFLVPGTKEHTIFCIGFPYPRRNDETLDCVLPEADA